MIIPSHLKMSADGLMRAILQQKRKMGIKSAFAEKEILQLIAIPVCLAR